MQGHDLNAIMASFEHLHVLNLVDRPILALVSAENTCVIFVQDASGLVNHH